MTETTPLPEIGQPAPDFSIASTNGPFTLSSLKGKHVVLFFYPKDNTPGCTTENEAFRDLAPQFAAANAIIVGVSRDSVKTHQNFKARLELPYTLLADIDEHACDAYRVIKMKKLYGKDVRGIERSTFLIDANGTLCKEWRGVKVSAHADEVLKAVQALGATL